MADRAEPAELPPLRPVAADELAAQLAAAASAGVPLGETFLALAEDSDDRRLRRVARELAERLNRGEDISSALAAAGAGLPPYLARTLELSAARDQLPELLAGLVRHEATRRRLRRQLRSAWLYPTIVLLTYLAVMLGLMLWIIPDYIAIYREFDIELPKITLYIINIAESAPLVVGVLLALPALYFAIGLWPGGKRMLHWFRSTAPLLGKVWSARAHHEFTSMLGALVDQRVVLDDALRCTVASLHDRNLARAARIAARKCEGGALLSQSLAESIHFDRTLPALVGCGEAHDDLAAALRQATAIYEQEIELQASFLRRVLPSLLFVLVVTTLFFFVVGLLVPLVNMANALFWW